MVAALFEIAILKSCPGFFGAAFVPVLLWVAGYVLVGPSAPSQKLSNFFRALGSRTAFLCKVVKTMGS
jgi:hypothetical protein